MPREGSGAIIVAGGTLSRHFPRLEGFQELDEIGLLPRPEVQPEQLIVVVDHRQEIRRAPVMEIGRVLPESPAMASSGIFR